MTDSISPHSSLTSDCLKPATKPFAGFEWSIALAYLRPAARNGFVSIFSAISFLGFFIGVMVLVVVISVMNGFRSELFNRILGIQGHAEAYSFASQTVDMTSLLPVILETPDVQRAVPLVMEQVLISSPDKRSFGQVRGIRPADLKASPIINAHIVEGSLDDFGVKDGVAIGITMARNLGIFVGQEVATTSAAGSSTPFGLMPRTTSHPVIAIYNTGFQDADQFFIMMPLEKAQKVYNQHEGIGKIEIYVEHPDTIEETIKNLASRLPPDLIINSWLDKLSGWRAALDLERRVMFLILSMIILVAMLNILGSLAMMVMVKSKTIAVLRTIGMSRGSVMRIFMISGTLIGLIGTAIGFVAGLLIAYNLGSIEDFFNRFGIELLPPSYFNLGGIPSEVRLGDNLLILALALGLSVAGTIYPSWRAARIEPVEALRYE